jgi:hypothetical protein
MGDPMCFSHNPSISRALNPLQTVNIFIQRPEESRS